MVAIRCISDCSERRVGGFNNKYDIPDAEVAQALRQGGTLEATRGPATARSALTTDDYDLDKGTGHVAAS